MFICPILYVQAMIQKPDKIQIFRKLFQTFYESYPNTSHTKNFIIWIGHKSVVNALDISSDGKYIISGGFDN